MSTSPGEQSSRAAPSQAPATPLKAAAPLQRSSDSSVRTAKAASATPQMKRAQQRVVDKGVSIAEAQECEPEDEYRESMFTAWFALNSSWLTSLVVHTVLLVVLGFVFFDEELLEDLIVVSPPPEEVVEPEDELEQLAVRRAGNAKLVCLVGHTSLRVTSSLAVSGVQWQTTQ